MKIGFFDSGLGGLTILKAVAKELPEYDYVFYGDTANLPYGDKTEVEVYDLTVKGIEFLFAANCSLVIVACNTASAETLSRIQNEYLPEHHPDKKVLGVIVPTIEELVRTKGKSAILLATKRTIESDKYQLELNKIASDIKLNQVSTPDLVLLIEIGDIDLASEAAIQVIERDGGDSEVVVLGCTHYTELKNTMREHFSNHKIILSQDEIIPAKLKEYLSNHPSVESQLSQDATRNIHLSEHKERYDRLIQHFLGGALIKD